jgi:magnesium transporter
MNVPYPGFGRPVGFVASMLVITVMGGVLYATFRRRNWI